LNAANGTPSARGSESNRIAAIPFLPGTDKVNVCAGTYL
jgi:hypothetical protein